MTTYNIYPIPFEVRGLEYLNLLHKHLQENSDVNSVFKINRFSWRHLLFAPHNKNEKRIIHVHWETNIYGSKFVLLSILRMLLKFPALWLLKIKGTKVVWTRHNLYSHDYPHPTVDRIGRFFMWQLADAVIIQEESFAKSEQLKRKNKNIVFISQGNYVGVYGPVWDGDKNKLREEYGLNPNNMILLSIGSIRPYKALPQLIKVINEAHKKGAKVHLLITGKASAEYGEEIKKLVEKNSVITLNIGFVPDNKIPEVLALADYTVFYYEDSSLSSAAMMMSLSYGVPVITRNIPASSIIVPKLSGFVFNCDEEFMSILIKLSNEPKPNRDGIIETVSRQDWQTVILKLKKTYVELF
jgi:beta-1,4-mannosyltransferase